MLYEVITIVRRLRKTGVPVIHFVYDGGGVLEQVRDREVALHPAGGEPRWALLTLERSRLGNADVILSWTYDVTPLKRVERELRKLSLAVEQSPVMIVV